MVDKLVDKCTETDDEEVEITDKNENKCNSCIVYFAISSIFLAIDVVIGAYFAYYKYRNRDKKMFLDIIMFIKNNFLDL